MLSLFSLKSVGRKRKKSPVATAKTVTATEVATDGTVVEDRWPPMDFPGLSTRVGL